MKKITQIGILGHGNMGSALARAWAGEGYKIFVHDKYRSRLPGRGKVFPCVSTEQCLNKSRVIILAVKPQDLPVLLKESAPLITRSKPLVVSIAAGIKTSLLEKKLGALKIVRVMPNLAVKNHQAFSYICPGKFAGTRDVSFVKKLFGCVGRVMTGEEVLVDKVTAVSGSGPGYVYYFMDCLYQSALKLGIGKGDARDMVIQTFYGAIDFMREGKHGFRQCADMVSSRGGTTEAALSVFKKKNMDKIIHSGVNAAATRAEELSKGFDK